MMTRSTRHHPQTRRGSVIVVVIWAIAVATVITASVQLFAHRQASLAREATERLQTRWAARAGIEQTMAVMREYTSKPDPEDAKAMTRAMYWVSEGTTNTNAEWTIRHQVDGRNVGGPVDEHAKMNLNRADDRGLLLVLDDMTLDVLDAIGDWLDTDDEASALGVERDYYLSLESPYTPRNGPLRTMGEVELIAGIWPKYFRGEDWNLNNRLDPNEDDAARSNPPDEPNGILEAEWSNKVTVYSTVGGPTESGLPRLYLEQATGEELEERLKVSPSQAEALIEYGKAGTSPLSDLIFNPLGGGGAGASGAGGQDGQGGGDGGGQGGGDGGGQGGGQGGGSTEALTDKQLRAVLAECMVEDPLDRLPGKMNLNTISAELLRDLITYTGMDEAVADEIIYMRESKPQGIGSLLDLRSIPNIRDQDLQALTQRFDVFSNIFTITSRGRSYVSGLECEIVCVVDRSTLPVRIIEYREQ